MTTYPAPSNFSADISDELLSAYLDGQVNDAERRKVEQALAADVALQTRLHSLQTTVSLLKATPRITAPRSFVLSEQQIIAAGGRVRTPKSAGGGWRRWLPQMMPLATAAVAVVFVLVLALDLTGQVRTPPTEEATVALMSSSTETQNQDASELAATISDAPQSAKMQASPQPESAAVASAPPTDTPAPTVELLATEVATVVQAEPTAEPIIVDAPAPQPTATMPNRITASAQPTAAPSPEANPNELVGATPVAVSPTDTPALPPTATPEPPEATPTPTPELAALTVTESGNGITLTQESAPAAIADASVAQEQTTDAAARTAPVETENESATSTESTPASTPLWLRSLEVALGALLLILASAWLLRRRVER